MKLPSACLALAFAALCLIPRLHAQGSLTPPGAPAPTMKTLDQVEARTPIAGGTSTVTIPGDGSYYLTGNIAVTTGDGIRFTANNASLDLNGFTVSSTASGGGGLGVNCTGTGSFVIRNGIVRGATTVNTTSRTFTAGGFQAGVFVAAGATSARIENVEVTGVTTYGIGSGAVTNFIAHCQVNISSYYGIYADGATVDECTVNRCANTGIQAGVVRGSVGVSYGATGINATRFVENSSGETLSTALAGIYGIFAENALNCQAKGTGGEALHATAATNCTGASTAGGTGIYATTVRGCTGVSVSGNGIEATVVADSQGTSSSAYGISATIVANSTGRSSTGVGINCSNATNCFGFGQSTGAGSGGIDCGTSGVATGCYGSAGTSAGFSIKARLANGCTLGSGSQTGIANKVNTF